jgi:hypothetical protein
VERRRCGRIQLERLCVVNFLGARPVRVSAVTENVGRGGALIKLEEAVPLKVGATVAVELILNAEITPLRKCMYCRGSIRRVLKDSPYGQARIGVRFDYVDFRALKNEHVLQTAVV